MCVCELVLDGHFRIHLDCHLGLRCKDGCLQKGNERAWKVRRPRPRDAGRGACHVTDGFMACCAVARRGSRTRGSLSGVRRGLLLATMGTRCAHLHGNAQLSPPAHLERRCGRTFSRTAAESGPSRPHRLRRRVYAGNLSWSVTDGDLADFMQQAGDVKSAEVIKYPDGRSKVSAHCAQRSRVESCSRARWLCSARGARLLARRPWSLRQLRVSLPAPPAYSRGEFARRVRAGASSSSTTRRLPSRRSTTTATWT